MKRFALISLCLALAGPSLFAQAGQLTCPYPLPVPSPVLSSSPDDIPATNVDILTYTGAHAKVRSNNGMCYVQINANDQRVWFSPDADPGLHRCFYNRRSRADATSPWYWQYASSPEVLGFGAPSSAGPTAILYSATPKYLDSRTGVRYEFLMYQVYQPGSCDGQIAGFLTLAFSHDGICWTQPPLMARQGTPGPTYDCYPYFSDTVLTESAAAFDNGNWLYILYSEGNVSEAPAGYPSIAAARLGLTTNMSRALAYVAYASIDDPGLIRPLAPAEFTTAGMFRPVWASFNPDRYSPYNYFINMQATWDVLNGDLYVSRAYPYPFDRGSSGDLPANTVTPTPAQAATVEMLDPNTGLMSKVGGCYDSPATLPNRSQIYKMHLGSLVNLSWLTTQTWTLVSDFGRNAGYGNTLYGTVDTTPLVAGQSDAGRDYSAVSFLRDGAGNLVRTSGTGYYFAGDGFKLSKSHGPCQITGLETNTLKSLP